MTITTSTDQPRFSDGTFTTKSQSTPELSLVVDDDRTAAGSNLTGSVTLAVLAGHPDANVRAAVAGNLATDTRALRALSTDLDSKVRRAVAQNPCTAPYDIGQLAGEANPLVSRDALRNPNLPPNIQQRIMKSGTIEELRALAANTGACGMFLEQLANHRDRGITRAVRTNTGASKLAKENASLY